MSRILIINEAVAVSTFGSEFFKVERFLDSYIKCESKIIVFDMHLYQRCRKLEIPRLDSKIVVNQLKLSFAFRYIACNLDIFLMTYHMRVIKGRC